MSGSGAAALLLSFLISTNNFMAHGAGSHMTFIKNQTAVTEDFSASYRAGKYYEALKNVELSGNLRQDMLAVAASQIGYCAGMSGNDLSGDAYGIGPRGNFSEFGRYLGKAEAQWCTEFACWCARQAGVPADILSNAIGADPQGFGAPCYSWEETVFGGGSYCPRPGDLVLFAYNDLPPDSKYLSHTAILAADIEQNRDYLILPTIEGNTGSMVKDKRRSVYRDGTLTNKEGKVAYFISPEYESLEPAGFF